MKTTGEVLRAASQRVLQGWCQGLLTDFHGSVCALGAINDALGVRLDSDGAHLSELPHIIAEALRLPPSRFPINPDAFRVADWNNADGQTAENVAAGLAYAALCWDEQQKQAAQEPSTVVA